MIWNSCYVLAAWPQQIFLNFEKYMKFVNIVIRKFRRYHEEHHRNTVETRYESLKSKVKDRWHHHFSTSLMQVLCWWYYVDLVVFKLKASRIVELGHPERFWSSFPKLITQIILVKPVWPRIQKIGPWSEPNQVSEKRSDPSEKNENWSDVPNQHWLNPWRRYSSRLEFGSMSTWTILIHVTG